MNMLKSTIWRWLLPVLATLAGLLSLAYLIPGGPRDWLAFFMSQDTHPGLFIIMMIVLPLFGFPISPFLILVGIKFGPYWAAIITSLIFSFHLVIAYLLTHSFLRRRISMLLARMNYQIPQIKESRRLIFSIIFMALPGLPYTIKNFSLAILNIPFSIYFTVGLVCNFLLALPFIGLGYALLTNKSFVLLFIAILAGGYVLTFWLKRKFTDEA